MTTTAIVCLRCHGDTAPGAALCHRCGNTILRHLRQLEYCYLALSAAPPSSDTDGRGSPGYASRSPARDEVIVETDPRSKADEHGHVATLAALTGWTRLVAVERGTDQPNQVSITGECGYLRHHHQWITAQPWADEYASELAELHHRLVALVGLAPDPPAGDCMRIDCHGQVYPLPDASGVRCRACRTVYTGLALVRLQVEQQATLTLGRSGEARCGE